jgi:hypothetical protein
MPCFHWPSTSIQEKTWNSKSCPDGLPRQRNGTIAAKEAPASSRARKVEFLSKWKALYQVQMRLAKKSASHVSTGRAILLHRKNSGKINRKETKRQASGVRQRRAKSNRPAVNELAAKGGVSILAPGFASQKSRLIG